MIFGLSMRLSKKEERLNYGWVISQINPGEQKIFQHYKFMMKELNAL